MLGHTAVRPTLFISDLHLDTGRPDVQQALLTFLDNIAKDCEALYILGDFFEVWIGDDATSPFVDRVIAALSALPCSVFIMHGNRDFLLGEQFCAQTGATLLSDPTTIDLYGTKTLLMHGDSLCTGDLAYMQVREQLRSPAFQAEFLAKSLPERAAFAAHARQQSQAHTQSTDMGIMDVTPSEVVRVMADAGVLRLIHGHTHRPGRHAVWVEGESAERLVLGDWDQLGWFIQADPSGIRLNSFSI